MPTAHQPCCLIAEDQVLIGMALEATLEAAGIPVAGPFTSCADALAWVETSTPRVAVLDFKLKDGSCTELARALIARRVPVIIYTGMPAGAEMRGELPEATWLEKPVPRAELLRAIQAVAPGLMSPMQSSA